MAASELKDCRLLLVEDETNLLLVLEENLRREGFEVVAFSDSMAAIDAIELNDFDVVLSDLAMPGSTGLDVLDQCRRLRPDLPVILMTAFGSVQKAVEAMRRGAFDFITKPFETGAVVEVLQKAVSVIQAQQSEPRASVQGDPWGVARVAEPESPMSQLLMEIEGKAALASPVCIMGEHGTGKEALARELHRLSPNGGGPFVKLHCAAVAADVLEVELFGIEESSRPGKIELADGGSLFLEQVSHLPSQIQDRVLRFIKDGTFERVGGFRRRRSSARVVASTEEKLLRRGARLKSELATALSAVTLEVPPLRERRMDIRRLSLFFLRQATARTNGIVTGMSDELATWLALRDWPGNLRQLENGIESMVAKSSEPLLSIKDATAFEALAGMEARPFKEQVKIHSQQFERVLIEAELERNDGNVSRTAESLGVSRKGLQIKLKELGIK